MEPRRDKTAVNMVNQPGRKERDFEDEKDQENTENEKTRFSTRHLLYYFDFYKHDDVAHAHDETGDEKEDDAEDNIWITRSIWQHGTALSVFMECQFPTRSSHW